MELTLASSRWGEAYAASHAQLSLIGYGSAGGHWDESALGSFGEHAWALDEGRRAPIPWANGDPVELDR